MSNKFIITFGRYWCMECAYVTSLRANIKRHRVMHRIIRWKFPCDQCDYKATVAENLRLHVRKQHYKRPANAKSLKKTKECDRCPFTTDSSSILRKHTRHHNCGLDFLCDFCDFATGTRDQLLSHRKLHRCEPEYSNDYQPPRTEGADGDASTGRKTRRRSARMVEEDVDCRECPYQTRSPSLLRNHMAYHAQQARYVCDLCTFSSHKASQVQTHRSVHNDEDGFVAFKAKRSLLNDEYCLSIYARRILDALPKLDGLNKQDQETR